MKNGTLHKLNKISRPVLPDTIKRERLFKMLDDRPPGALTWITGAAGAGKSTLTADYLQRRNKPHIWYRLDDGDNDLSYFFYYLGEALKGLTAKRAKAPPPFLTAEFKTRMIDFSRCFFEYLGKKAPTPFMLVFDNFHEKSLDAFFQTCLKEGILAFPPAVQVIVISRESPPGVFLNLPAQRQLRVIGNADLLFTAEETEALLRKETGKTPPPAAVQQIHEITKGWAAGLRLILIGIMGGKSMPDSIAEINFDNIFDYFDSELFQFLNPRIRFVLVKSALWPRMPLSVLKSSMKGIDIGGLLNQLAENHFFIEQYGDGVDTVYQYHPLFHEFLKSRIAEYLDPKEIRSIQIQTAIAFEKFGWVEEALELFLQAHRYEDYRRVILKNAAAMVRRLHHKTLKKWLLLLPEGVRAADPWLNYWTGISHRFSLLSESRKYFESAFEQFKKTDDMNGTLLAWSSIVDMITYGFEQLLEMDPYIEWLKGHIKKSFRFDSKESEARFSGSAFYALYSRETQNRDLPFWRKRALASIEACNDITEKIAIQRYAIISWVFTRPNGQLSAVRKQLTALTEGHESRLVRLANLWVKAYSFFMTDVPAAEVITTATQGLALAETIQMHSYDGTFYVTGIMASLTVHDLRTSDSFLRQLKSGLSAGKLYFMFLYHYLKCVHDFNAAEFEAAVRHGKTALEITQKTGRVLLELLTNLQVQQADFFLNPGKEAIAETDRIIQAAAEKKSPMIAYQARFAKSYMLLSLGREAESLKCLKETLLMGRQNRLIRFVWSWPCSIIEKLCATALEHNLETKFVRQMIRSYQLYPAAPENVLKNWIWPIQIETLGRFEVRLEGQKADADIKGGIKPRELLQLLIALGPRPIAIDKIIDHLWPEKDGDLAYASFKTTLGRLRSLLRVKECLLVRGNKVSINHRICLIDLEMFDRALERAHRESGADRYAWLEKAVDLYRGGFLAGEPEKPWIAVRREEVKEKFLSAITELGVHYERGRQTERAVARYKQGLGKEPAEEILYQHLMSLCAKRGEKSEVLKWYQRCRTELQRRYAVKPSKAIQTIRERFD